MLRLALPGLVSGKKVGIRKDEDVVPNMVVKGVDDTAFGRFRRESFAKS